MKEIRCPYCRSLYQLDGQLDFSAPKIQVVNCPVCNYPQEIASDFPIPVKWINPAVMERNEPLISWNEFKKTKAAAVELSKPPPLSEQQPIYAEFFKGITFDFAKYGIWIVAALVLILLIKRR